jgi:hypothetical protein
MADERSGKIEKELVPDRTDQNPGVEQFIVRLPERVRKDGAVSLQIGLIGAVVLGGQKVARNVV